MAGPVRAAADVHGVADGGDHLTVPRRRHRRRRDPLTFGDVGLLDRAQKPASLPTRTSQTAEA